MTTPRVTPGKFGILAAICGLLALVCALLNDQTTQAADTANLLRYLMYGLGGAALLAGLIGFVIGENWRANGIGMLIGAGVFLAPMVSAALSMLLGILVLLAILGSLGMG